MTLSPFQSSPAESHHQNRVEVWDGWRGLAICFVLIGHFIDVPHMREDRLGVDVFFVLSGMLMSGILFENRMPLKTFYVRRFSRIYPALLVFVLATFAVSLQTGMEFKLSELFANLTFIRTYYPADLHIWDSAVQDGTARGAVFLGHLWSLNVEEHAYLIMSLITLVLASRQRAALALAALGLGAIAISILYYNGYGYSYGGQHFYIRTESAISFVFLSAAYNLLRKQFQIRVAAWLPVLALAAAIVCYRKELPFWLTFTVTPLLLAFSVNHLQEASHSLRWLLTLTPLRLMGLWSYSIYLWQQPFYKGSGLLPGGHLAGLCLAMGFGIFSYYCIEQPLRSRINNYWSVRRSRERGARRRHKLQAAAKTESST